MKPMLIVDADTLRRERRRTLYAYVGSFIAQVIAFTWGFLVGANWQMLVERFQ